MKNTRTAVAAGLLVVEAGLAALGGLVHYGLTAEYGDITDSALEGLLSGFTVGTGGPALVLVGAAAVAAALISPRRWVRVTAVGIPALMVIAMFAVTPVALRHKLEVQYDAAPRCVFEEDMGAGPGLRAARQSQDAFESIEHVGHFGGGGGSGLGGCGRSFIVTEDVDVLKHYRVALPAAGWGVVEDESDYLRAERDDMAFEVAVCDRGGLVWAGKVGDRGQMHCDRSSETVTGTP